METPFLSLWPFLNPLLLLPFSKTNTQPTHVAEEEENDLPHNIGLFFLLTLLIPTAFLGPELLVC